MPNRRDFFRSVAGAATGMYVVGRGGNATAQAPAARRQATIAGRRVRVVDVHAHTNIPLGDVVKGTPFEKQGGGNPGLVERLAAMTNKASTPRR